MFLTSLLLQGTRASGPSVPSTHVRVRAAIHRRLAPGSTCCLRLAPHLPAQPPCGLQPCLRWCGRRLPRRLRSAVKKCASRFLRRMCCTHHDRLDPKAKRARRIVHAEPCDGASVRPASSALVTALPALQHGQHFDHCCRMPQAQARVGHARAGIIHGAAGRTRGERGAANSEHNKVNWCLRSGGVSRTRCHSSSHPHSAALARTQSLQRRAVGVRCLSVVLMLRLCQTPDVLGDGAGTACKGICLAGKSATKLFFRRAGPVDLLELDKTIVHPDNARYDHAELVLRLWHCLRSELAASAY